MKPFLRCCIAALVLLLPGVAGAAYNCSISSGGFSTAYSPTAGTTNITSTSFTITCTRALSDATTMSWSASANNGLYSNGTNNRASFGGSFIRYDVFKDAACATQWKGPSTFTGTLNFGGSTSASVTVSYWGCVTAGQTGLPAGTYTDTVTATLNYGPNPQLTATTTFPVSIATPATCSLTNAPGNIVFNYIALKAAVNASTTFGVTCTSYLPYTMALDATTGTIVGINYTLALSAASASGSGSLQTYSINGATAAGQPGTCGTGACSGTQARVLTITY